MGYVNLNAPYFCVCGRAHEWLALFAMGMCVSEDTVRLNLRASYLQLCPKLYDTYYTSNMYYM